MVLLFGNQSFFQVIAILIGLAPLLRLAVNNYNMTPVEKIMLTNEKKVLYLSLEIFMMSNLASVFILTMAWSNRLLEGMSTRDVIILFIVSTGFCIVVMFSLVLVILFFGNLLKIKVDFYIKDDDGEKWILKRRINKKQMLLRGENNNIKFYLISDLYEREIFEALKHEKGQKKFVKKNRYSEGLLITGFLLFGSGNFMLFSDNLDIRDLIVYLGIYLLSISFILPAIIARTNEKVYLRLSKEGN